MKRFLLRDYRIAGIALILTLCLGMNAFALDGFVEGEKIETSKYIADTIWVLVAAFLVFFMQAGFSMVEAGFTRAKNAVNILMKNLMDFSMGAIAYWAIGFAIMFGDGNGFLGLSGWFVSGETKGFSALEWSSVPTLAAWLFQLVFAATAATIVSGAMAERTKFRSYLIYSVFHHRFNLSDCRTLDLGRRLAVEHGNVGFCRLNGCPLNGRLARLSRRNRTRCSHR